MYLYHHVSNKQTGSIIYPLNELKNKHPEIYRKQSAKYDNIQEKDVEIPGFGYWNDCINLMPVSPDLVKKELVKFGHNTNWPWIFYKIDSETLDNSKLVIMVPLESNNISRRQFIKFNKTNFDKYCHIGGVTRQRYQNAKDNNEQPNTFAGVPHVLYKGSIDTSNLEIIKF
jgi:hypothetical protein